MLIQRLYTPCSSWSAVKYIQYVTDRFKKHTTTIQHSHSPQTIKVNREEILHRKAHEWKRIIATVNKNVVIHPSDSKIIPLIGRYDIRCEHGDSIRFLIHSDNGLCCSMYQ